MLLVVDIGNTHTVAGLYALDSAPGAEPQARWRWQTSSGSTADEMRALISRLLELDGWSLGDIHQVAVSSVVPGLTSTWRELGAALPGTERSTLVVGPGLRTGLRITTSDPSEVGADRIVNAVAAWERYGTACIVVDMGTATTLDAISPDGAYVGGAIAPGLAISVAALVEHAARLSSVELALPERAIGRDTRSSMQSGTMLGTVAQLEGLLARFRAELIADHGADAAAHIPAIATGGLATLLRGHVDGLDDVDDDLTLRGLQLLALHR